MQNEHRAKLANIKRFDQLRAYLRDEMGWPLQNATWDELTFDFTADELGIDPKTAAKIQEIKRLRPLSPKQPWGIFFVKFEPKRLPVIALRRILSQIALKKRASSNSAERAAWAADDLLFVSNYGEGDERQISFAHFSQAEEGNDLPTLKVLGWDNLDTALHLDAVARELREHLAWPADDSDAAVWRSRWRAAFHLRHREVVTTSKQLSIRLAELARNIRDRIKTALWIETDKGPLTRLMKAFQTTLVNDLDADGFADMYAQTIAYGLLSARISDPHKKTADDFAAHMRTNPFLRELMETFLRVGGRRGKAGGPGIDFDELGVSDVVQELDEANMEAVVRDFGDKNPLEDPVIHFYELFLKEYDAKKRLQRGVFYTPRPVVSYIVRSVDELLRTEFGLKDGLADTTTWGEMVKRYNNLTIPDGTSSDEAFVRILDPATGTGTFLVEVIGVIYQTLCANWRAQGHSEAMLSSLWNEYVPEHLLPRLHAYELLMAPYAIAHLKVGLKLHETGYLFATDERARIFLTNALEPASDRKHEVQFTEWLPALAHEARAVDDVKRKQGFTVVLGNPPYSGLSANMLPAMRALIDPYRVVDGQTIKEKGALQFEKNLNDDYVKFLRFAESHVERTVGVVSLITNNAYLESATLRGLRSHLLDTFSSLRFLDLHGDSDKRETTSIGRPDENVFDIKHGVAIATLVRRIAPTLENARKGTVFRWDLKDSRENKYRWLLQYGPTTIRWTELSPRGERYLFKVEDTVLAREYESFASLANLLEVNSTGFESGRDEILTAFSKDELRSQLHAFCSEPAEAVRGAFNVAEAWGAVLFAARKGIENDPAYETRFQKFLFGPFDIRWCFYRKDLLKTNSFSAGKHLGYGRNIALILMRQVSLDSGFTHVGLSKLIVNNRCFYSTKGKVSYFPIFLYSGESDLIRREGELLGSNLRTSEMVAWGRSLGLKWDSGAPGTISSKGALTAMDATRYVFAVLHSPLYRIRYEEFLKIDFPRVPIPSNLRLFRDLGRLGGELAELYLLESPRLDQHSSTYVGPKNPTVERVYWSADTVWLDAPITKRGQPGSAGTIGFRAVPEDVWNFRVGGYRVCEKWLKDRKGRKLSKDDIDHYQKIVVALAETIRLMTEIDSVIEQHGGWPSAFQATSYKSGVSRPLLKVAEPKSNYGKND